MNREALSEQLGQAKLKSTDWFVNKTNPREKLLIFIAFLIVVIVPAIKCYEFVDEIFKEQQQRLSDIEMKQRALPYRIQNYLQLNAQKDEMERSYKAIHSSDKMMSELERLLLSKDKVRPGFTIAPQKTEKFAEKYDMLPFKLNFDITDYSQLVELLYDLSVGKNPTIIRSITIQKASNNWQLRVAIELSGLTQTK